MFVMIDNYDSFTYNIYQYLTELTKEPVKVVRNDMVTVKDIEAMKPKGLIISPGPGNPDEAGISLAAIEHFKGKIPILGICLGHQCIAQAFGAKIVSAARVVHGKTEPISHDGKGLFRGLANPSVCTRYHSLAAEKESLPDCFTITARAADGEIMGIRHNQFPIEGVQFHPESIASEEGKRILANFLNYRLEPYRFKEHLASIISGRHLSETDAAGFMRELTEGSLTSTQIGAYLIALNAKGITAEEIAGCASVLQEKRVAISVSKPVLDTCGTGGDGHGTFNISSMSALIAASCGVSVAKHGNRAVSSKAGSSEFYEALGIKIDVTPATAEKMIEEQNFAFLFAPLYHGAMRHAAQPRRELGIKTIMNMLGPLANPAGAKYQVLGVSDGKMCRTQAEAARLLGGKRVMVVNGSDGMDEITVTGPTRVVMIDESGAVNEYDFDPKDLGIPYYTLDDLKGGTARDNAEEALALLEGRGRPAVRDAVCLNAGAALYVYGIAGSIADGFLQAKDAISGGLVKAKLNAVIQASHEA
ncbi:MAG: bifunctional anthranilate synthase component II/anthranilate phosphoribosyltransferase [Spirochaetales bacterium]|nr:bifunctional anthranilate synthase component II/anthranilate phosphoribosyltransferase [Spirochaetales bacterium]